MTDRFYQELNKVTERLDNIEDRQKRLEGEINKNLSDDDVDHIAERVEQRFYARVGKSFVQKFLTALAIIVIAVATYITGRSH